MAASILRYELKGKARTRPDILKVGFGSVCTMLPMRGLGAKMGPKTIIFNHGDKALNVSSFNLFRKNKQFNKEYQNRMKNHRFMPIRRSHAKVAVGLFWSHFLRY